jgi:predicted glycosyl hydrolase (DUF1957 family)
MNMKKIIAAALLAATLSTAGTAAFAYEGWSFESEFPGMATYSDLHRNDPVGQADSPFPSSANETTSLASEFPQIATYADSHRNDAVNQAASAFPSSANETTSMADGGLSPGSNIGANAHAGIAQPARN